MITYSPAIEAEIEHLVGVMAEVGVNGRIPHRWLAIQLLEGDTSLLETIANGQHTAIESALAASQSRLQTHFGEDVDIAITDARYQRVHELVQEVISRPPAVTSLSDRIDRIIIHKWLGIPIFLALMYLVFNLVQNVSAPYLNYIDGIISGPITSWVTALLEWVHAPVWLISLVTDGIIAGVGGVLVFLPGLLVMYIALAILEDSGYLARAAFVTDRFMAKLGLHGRSFVPMILGFGCNVPAIYATRTIENRPARILTGLLIPFMSCSARLPVYVIFGLAFFPHNGDLVIWSLYMIGILMAALVGTILSRTVFKDSPPGILLMEMPAYRLPSPRRVLNYAWEQSASFVRKAGTFILAGTIVFWALMNLPWGVTSTRDSYFGRFSNTVAPVFAPAGFGQWQQTGALLTGLLAKEMVVSTMAQVYVGEVDSGGDTAVPPTFRDDIQQITLGFVTATIDAGKELLETLTPGLTLFATNNDGQETALTTALQAAFTPLTAFAFMIFVLLYIPCLPTISAQVNEFGWRWALFSMFIMLAVPWTLAVLIYQGGKLLGAT
ncbi:MAG: ferrous iron transport protein B [Ardenticatenaceae bacterium]|nr:ferrous iron transport protein B [Ardenticatenaceae bacterium]